MLKERKVYAQFYNLKDAEKLHLWRLEIVCQSNDYIMLNITSFQNNIDFSG